MATKSDSNLQFTEKVINIPFRHPLALDNEVVIKGPNDLTEPTGIEGTLVIPTPHSTHQLPKSRSKSSSSGTPYVRPQRRVVIIAHGQNGHRNYVYQKLLSQSLASKNGLYAFRFDFRNCGNSQNVDTKYGLTTDAERIDLTVVIDYLKNTLGLLPAAIVGHSRGSNASMIWTLEQQLNHGQASAGGATFIPSLVNCSGRFRTELIFDWYRKNMPDVDFFKTEYFKVEGVRRFNDIKTDNDQIKGDNDGKQKKSESYWTRHEPLAIASYDMTQLKYLRSDTNVLTIHGDNDDVINVKDAYLFDKVFQGRHELKIFPNANHNYFVSNHSVIGATEGEYPTGATSKKSKKLESLVPEVVDIIVKYLSMEEENKRFHKYAEVIASTHVKQFNNEKALTNASLHTNGFNYIQKPRWQRQIKNIINFRDFGGYPTSGKRGIRRLWIKPGILYRCGKMDYADDADKRAVAKLGIKQVFDLRSESEVCSKKDSKNARPQQGIGLGAGILFQGLPDSGITTTHTPLFSEKEYNPEALARRFSTYASENGFSKTYTEILTAGATSGQFKYIFNWIKNNPNVPFVVHCSAGKDRTGIFAMLILLLLDVERDTVAHEYELTTAGYAPEREKILSSVRSGMVLEKLKQEEAKMLMQESKDRASSSKEFLSKIDGLGSIRGWENLLSSRYENMLDTMDLLDKKFGGVMHYLENVVGVPREDLLAIKENLLYYGDEVEVRRTFYPSKL